MKATIVTAPATEPVTLAEAKSHLRVDISDDDTLIGTLIETARIHAENITRRKFIEQTWDFFFDKFPGDEIIVPFGSLTSVTSVKYIDSDGVTNTWDSESYIVDTDSEPGRVLPEYGESFPSDSLYNSNPVIVRAVLGYGDVPAPIKAAILLILADLYEIREPGVVGTIYTPTKTVENLLASYRLFL